MNINEPHLFHLPFELTRHIFGQADMPFTLPCTCKLFYHIFSNISFDFYRDNVHLKERAERIQQEDPSATYHTKITALYESLIQDVNHTSNNYFIKQDTFSASYEALLSARHQTLYDKEKISKHISSWRKNKYLLPIKDVPLPAWPHKEDLCERDAKLMMRCIHQSVGRLAELDSWLEDTNLIQLSKILEQIIPLSIQEKEPDIHAQAQQIRTWLECHKNDLDFIDELSFPGKNLSSLPKEIGMLEYLEVLTLNHNHLSSLPKEIEKLQHLVILYLDNNHLTSLPKEIEKLPYLEVLNIENNQLTSLPEWTIRLFTHCDFLDLANNRLTSLPEQIGQLTQLKVLDLEDNQLTSLPKGIGQLTRLTELFVGHNQLASLPEEMGRLTNLKVLDLHNNQLTNLPKEIKQSITNNWSIKLNFQNNFLDLLDMSIWDKMEEKDIEDLLQLRPFLSLEDINKFEAAYIIHLVENDDTDTERLSDTIELFSMQKQHILEIDRLNKHSKSLSPEQIEQLKTNHFYLMEELFEKEDLESCRAILNSLKKLQ